MDALRHIRVDFSIQVHIMSIDNCDSWRSNTWYYFTCITKIYFEMLVLISTCVCIRNYNDIAMTFACIIGINTCTQT